MATLQPPARYNRHSPRTSRTQITGPATIYDRNSLPDRHRRSSIDEQHEFNQKSQERFAKVVESIIHGRTRRVAVLLISWENHESHSLNTTKELHDLTTVFRTKFNFDVQTKLLNIQTQQPRYQLSAILAGFLADYDHPDTQLIIYYGGHGMLNENEDTLRLLGRNPVENDPLSTELNWNDVEPQLYRIRADLLLIFDCCHAGFVAREQRRWPESKAHFEFIGSTAFYEIARGPKSSGSFTRAMITALNGFADESKPFTASSLHHRIMTDPQFRRTEQQPVVSTCGKNNSHAEMRIMALDEKPDHEDPETLNFYLHLKYVFSKKPSDADMNAITDRLRELIKNDRLPIKNFLWEGLSMHNPRMSMADAGRLLLVRLGRCSRDMSPLDSLDVSASTDKPFDKPQRTLTTLSVDQDSTISRSLNRVNSGSTRPESSEAKSPLKSGRLMLRMFHHLCPLGLARGICLTSLVLCVGYTAMSASHSVRSWLEGHSQRLGIW